MGAFLIILIALIFVFSGMCYQVGKETNHKQEPETHENEKLKNIYTYSMWEHGGWGNSIHWGDYEKRRVVGFLKRLPNKNDILRCKMQSGKIARFRFSEIDYKRYPPDMFAANMEDIGYEE